MTSARGVSCWLVGEAVAWQRVWGFRVLTRPFGFRVRGQGAGFRSTSKGCIQVACVQDPFVPGSIITSLSFLK